MSKVKWDKGGSGHWADAGGFELIEYIDGRWYMHSREGGPLCGCDYDCGRCHMGQASSRKQARKAAVRKWREVVAAEKAAQVKPEPEPEPVPVDAPTKPAAVKVEIVRPEREVKIWTLKVGDSYVRDNIVWEVEEFRVRKVNGMRVKVVSASQVGGDKVEVLPSHAMVEPCTVKVLNTVHVVATVTT